MKKFLVSLAVSAICFFILGANSAIFAITVSNPDEIKVLGLVSFGEDGAAWLKIGTKELLVSPGYLISRDLRVVAIRSDSVTLYRQLERKYYSLPLTTGKTLEKLRNQAIWSYAMPLWKVVRMVALAYRKDYICHFETSFEVAPRRQVANMNQMMEFVVSPHNRFRGKDGVIYVSPVNVNSTSWTWFIEQVRKFKSEDLVKWFPSLSKKGTLISNGRNLQSILLDISRRCGVPIRWNIPVPYPVFCSFKDRPWHQIIENIVLYNGLALSPSREGLLITGTWQ